MFSGDSCDVASFDWRTVGLNRAAEEEEVVVVAAAAVVVVVAAAVAVAVA